MLGACSTGIQPVLNPGYCALMSFLSSVRLCGEPFYVDTYGINSRGISSKGKGCFGSVLVACRHLNFVTASILLDGLRLSVLLPFALSEDRICGSYLKSYYAFTSHCLSMAWISFSSVDDHWLSAQPCVILSLSRALRGLEWPRGMQKGCCQAS